MKHLICVACFLLFAADASAREIPDTWPEWLRDAMAREAKPRKAKEFSMADDTISGEVRGKFVEKPSLNDNYWYFATDIKADSEFMCWIFPEAIDTASSTAAIIDNLINMNAESLGGVGVKSLYYQDVYNHEGSPVMALEWVWSSAPEENRQIGFAKVRTALVGDSSLICAHTTVGYRDTFAEAFDHLLANIKIPRARSPYYETLHSVSINDTTVGFARASMTEDAEGDTEIRTINAMMMPVDEANLTTTDGTTLEFSEPNGQLINQYYTTAENGNIVVNAQLGFAEGAWQVTGTVQGKEIEMTIDDSTEVASSLGQLLQVRDMMKAGEEGAIDFPMWLADVDPTAFSTVQVELTGSDTGKMTLGPMVFDAKLDEHGNLERGVAELGGMTMSLEKAWEQGAP